MAEIEYRELQRRFPGQYIAQRDGEVVANAETYDELRRQLQERSAESQGLIIEFVEPPDSVAVY
jgi:hypothetical protein